MRLIADVFNPGIEAAGHIAHVVVDEQEVLL